MTDEYSPIYVSYDRVAAKFDERTLTQLTDDDNDSKPDEDVVNQAIEFREGWVEGFVRSAWREGKGPSVALVRAAKPPQVLLWILDAVIYDLYTHRPNALPAEVAERMQAIEIQLRAYGNTGVPDLIEDDQSTANPISGNMVADDLGELTEDGEALPWSEVL